MDVLLISTVQNDFLPGGPLGVPDGYAIVAPINRLLQQFDFSVATQLWQTPDDLRFVENHPGRKPFDTVTADGTSRVLLPAHCVANTLGAEFPKELRQDRLSEVVRIGTDPNVACISNFFDSHRRPTGLETLLRDHNATRIFLCGLPLDIVVWTTGIDALKLGFEVVLVQDACRGLDPVGASRAGHDLPFGGAQLASSDALPLS